ncbi:hypothetical protein [Thiolapillus sp.]
MNQFRRFLLMLPWLWTTSIHAQPSGAPFPYTMGITYINGSLDGFVQTPAGGEPGTTSRSRPTFDELDFDRQTALDAYAMFNMEGHQFEIGGQWQRQSGKSVIRKDLVSQKKFFPVGTQVNADIQTDWYRINYLYALNRTNENISLSAGGGLVWFDFDYQLKSHTAKADRAYSKLGYRIGAAMTWRINDRFTLDSRLFAPIPLPNTPEVWTLDINAKYSLWESAASRTLLSAGVGYNRLDYEDGQKVPNHIRVEISPYFRLGLILEF